MRSLVRIFAVRTYSILVQKMSQTGSYKYCFSDWLYMHISKIKKILKQTFCLKRLNNGARDKAKRKGLKEGTVSEPLSKYDLLFHVIFYSEFFHCCNSNRGQKKEEE